MGKQDEVADEFKQEAVAQIVAREHAVGEVAVRLEISSKSPYTWKALFSKPVAVRNSEAEPAAELQRVRKELVRGTEERDILKKRPRTSRGNSGEWSHWFEPNGDGVHQGSSGRVFRSNHVPRSDGVFQRIPSMA